MELEKAILVFLDAIEKSTSETSGSMKALKESLGAMVASITGTNTDNTRLYADSLKSITQANIKNKIDMLPVVAAIKNFEEIAARHAAEQNRTIDKHYGAISSLLTNMEAALKKEKKWTMKIDRNHRTQMIDNVIIEQVKE